MGPGLSFQLNVSLPSPGGAQFRCVGGEGTENPDLLKEGSWGGTSPVQIYFFPEFGSSERFRES